MDKNLPVEVLATPTQTPAALLQDFFTASVSRWPDAIAIDVPPGKGRPTRLTMRYAQLAQHVNALRHALHPYVNGECVVAILLPRDGAFLYAAQLAVLNAGAAYTCIDPAYPDARVRELMEDAKPVVLITDAAGWARCHPLTASPVIDVDIAAHAPYSPTPSPDWLTPGTLAYVVYTSGTTGRPKGVLIEHRSVVNLVASDLDAFQLNVGDRVAQGSSAAYDSSVEETWLAFAAGATLVVMDEDSARLGPDLVTWLAQERINVFCPPPTLLRATGCGDPLQALPDLKILYVGGEALPADVAARWARGRRMVNGYGPTECTVTCMRSEVVPGQAVTIGLPVPGATAWVLDDKLQPVEDDRAGELCIGGVGLARGYGGSPDLTAEKFILHPALGRLYRTGDLVRRDHACQFRYEGRIDSQVKIRGHRIELGEIEARLAACDGVRAAACHLQTDGEIALLVAFVVAADSASPPSVDALHSALARELPVPMRPARIGFLRTLPTTVGGKLNRAALPRLDAATQRDHDAVVGPRNALEARLEQAFRNSLKVTCGISIHDDFFSVLGGDSLSAAILVTLLRADEATSWVTVRHIYEARNIATLASLAPLETRPNGHAAITPKAPSPRAPVLVTVLQSVWLMLVFGIASLASYLAAFVIAPRVSEALGLVASVLLAAPMFLLALFLYAPISVAVAVIVKKILIGRYRPLRAPIWGSFYLRNWIVQQTVRMIPWRSLEGTAFQHMALRALGARIGERVHIHRSVNLIQGGWDMLDIGDDVTLNHSAALHLVETAEGDIIFAPITIDNGVTLDVRSAVAGHTVLEAGASLSALSSLAEGCRISAGERWDGIPARAVGRVTPPATASPTARAWSPTRHGVVMLAARALAISTLALPMELLVIATCVLLGVDTTDVWAWLSQSGSHWSLWLVASALALIGVPLTLLSEAVMVRAMGRIPTGCIGRWSLAYVRVWLKADLVEAAGRWLSGTLLWPVWLRAAGMKVGNGCEVSTIIDVIPEHIEIGDESFFADGIYLGGPYIDRGTVTLAMTRLGKNTFLGNHVVVPAGQQLPDDILIGVCTVADDKLIRHGTAWFGLPPFELPRRAVVQVARTLTHEPTRLRYLNRVFWELLRFALPITPLLVLVAWLGAVAEVAAADDVAALLLVPLASLAAVLFMCAVVIALKWLLLWRVRPGQHALWSCWCSRWDFLFVAWGQYAAPVLANLEGCLLLNHYLRAMGMRLGARVALGGGFSQVVDPDMIHIEDDATVNASFQAHTFEDRVLKIDRVYVRRGATLGSNTVPLYGADIGEHTHVASHSVVMKGERLSAGRRYEGAPTR